MNNIYSIHMWDSIWRIAIMTFHTQPHSRCVELITSLEQSNFWNWTAAILLRALPYFRNFLVHCSPWKPDLTYRAICGVCGGQSGTWTGVPCSTSVLVSYLSITTAKTTSTTQYQCKGKGEVVPLQARCGPEGSRRLRLLDFHDIRHMKVVRLSASHTGRLHPQVCSWYSFSLGVESTAGPWCGRKEICHWKIQWHHTESIRDLPTCSAAP
jgi:hypothetical protein